MRTVGVNAEKLLHRLQFSTLLATCVTFLTRLNGVALLLFRAIRHPANNSLTLAQTLHLPTVLLRTAAVASVQSIWKVKPFRKTSTAQLTLRIEPQQIPLSCCVIKCTFRGLVSTILRCLPTTRRKCLLTAIRLLWSLRYQAAVCTGVRSTRMRASRN